MPATGHAKNVANFETAIIVLTDLGAEYNPSQPLIQLSALQAKLAAAKDALAAVDSAGAAKTIAVNERAAAFEALDKFAVNVKRAAEVEVNNDAFTRDLLSIVRKFRSPRAGSAPVDNPATPDTDESLNTHSVSQRSYDSLAAHFARLISLLKVAQPPYNPNEPEMKISGLEAKLAALETKNRAAKTARAQHAATLAARDGVLYHKDTGILKLIKLIKTQLARQPGIDSPAYEQINALEFKKG